uniref:Uncharacterized protein n=1 Tax=Leersia perrieri TaxID=77586 RepID=A0A0D9XGW4_9ORYZ
MPSPRSMNRTKRTTSPHGLTSRSISSPKSHAADDFVRFHAVCTSWLRAHPPNPPRFLPWLCDADTGGEHRTARSVDFSNSTTSIHRRRAAPATLCVPDKRVYIGDKARGSLYPLTFFTGSVPPSPVSLPRIVSAWAKRGECVVSDDGTVLLYTFNLDPSVHDDEYNCHALIVHNGSRWQWTLASWRLSGLSPRCGAVYVGDEIIVYDEGRWWCFTNAIVRDVDGDALLSVSVYALDLQGGGEFVRCDDRSMADRVLFLGKPTSLAVDAADLGIAGGCAYFVHRWTRTSPCHVVRYSFEDGRSEVVEQLPNPKAGFWKDDNFIWLTPSQLAIAPIELTNTSNKQN